MAAGPEPRRRPRRRTERPCPRLRPGPRRERSYGAARARQCAQSARSSTSETAGPCARARRKPAARADRERSQVTLQSLSICEPVAQRNYRSEHVSLRAKRGSHGCNARFTVSKVAEEVRLHVPGSSRQPGKSLTPCSVAFVSRVL